MLKNSEPVKVGGFGRALDVLKRGGLIRRESWPAADWAILMERAMPILNLHAPYGRALETMKQAEFHVEIAAHIDLHTEAGMQPGWQPTCRDMLADDWIGIPLERSPKGWKANNGEPTSEANYESDARVIARKIFEAGDAEGRCERIQFMLGKHPEREGGGFGEGPLADFIAKVLSQHRGV